MLHSSVLTAGEKNVINFLYDDMQISAEYNWVSSHPKAYFQIVAKIGAEGRRKNYSVSQVHYLFVIQIQNWNWYDVSSRARGWQKQWATNALERLKKGATPQMELKNVKWDASH